MKSNEQISRDMQGFVDEIYLVTASGSYARAKELDGRIKDYIRENEVPKELNLVLSGGYGEMLEKTLTAFEWERKHEI